MFHPQLGGTPGLRPSDPGDSRGLGMSPEGPLDMGCCGHRFWALFCGLGYNKDMVPRDGHLSQLAQIPVPLQCSPQVSASRAQPCGAGTLQSQRQAWALLWWSLSSTLSPNVALSLNLLPVPQLLSPVTLMDPSSTSSSHLNLSKLCPCTVSLSLTSNQCSDLAG